MKKILVFIILTLFLTSSVLAIKYTVRAVEKIEEGDSIKYTFRAVDEGEEADNESIQQKNQVTARALTQTQVQEIKKETNRIRAQTQENECPNNCTYTGYIKKSELEKGREMNVRAGQSGNVIFQVKGVEGSTNVTLYKSEGRIYGVFKNNNTKEVRVMPDMVKDKIRERLARELEDEEIELDEDGIYQYRAKKQVKLFGFIRTRIRVRAEINAETGELVRIKNSWWAFLTSDDTEPIIGASCGTVSPNSRNECCINKGYDLWNEEILECKLS